MAISETHTFSASVSTTELSITGGSTTIQTQTTDGAYQVFVDLSAAAAGDVFAFRAYEKARSSDTQRCVFYTTIATQGSADAYGWVSPPLLMMHGWDFTLIKLTGTDRTLTASVRSVA